MATITTASDSTTIVLNGTAITDLGVGDIVTITPVNPSATIIAAGNGGANINKRSDADMHDILINVQALSDSDSFLNSIERQDVPVPLSGSIKENFNRDGVEGVESWLLENGTFTVKPTRTYNDTDGNALIAYTIQFRTAKRNL